MPPGSSDSASKGIGREVVVSVATAVVLGIGTLFWNWASSGGIVHSLGGMTAKQLPAAIQDELKRHPPPGTVTLAEVRAEIASRPALPDPVAANRITSLLQALRTPKAHETFCTRGRNSPCTAKCVDEDEILVGGTCYVPGNGSEGTGYTQNIGFEKGRAWTCSMGSIPGLPSLGAVIATAWCVKLPQ